MCKESFLPSQLAPYIVSLTIHGEHRSLWYLSPIGPIDQFTLNVFLMANALVFGFSPLKPFVFGFWPQ